MPRPRRGRSDDADDADDRAYRASSAKASRLNAWVAASTTRRIQEGYSNTNEY